MTMTRIATIYWALTMCQALFKGYILGSTHLILPNLHREIWQPVQDHTTNEGHNGDLNTGYLALALSFLISTCIISQYISRFILITVVFIWKLLYLSSVKWAEFNSQYDCVTKIRLWLWSGRSRACSGSQAGLHGALVLVCQLYWGKKPTVWNCLSKQLTVKKGWVC